MTSTTLTAVCRFLGQQVPWIVEQPDFPLEDFADEIRACVRVLRRWDHEAEDRGQMVPCPTVMEDVDDDGNPKACGYRLYFRDPGDPHEHVECRRCGAVRNVDQLTYVAMSDGREVWLDPEAAARRLGVSEGHLRRMARRGELRREHGRYLVQTMEVAG